MPHVSQKKLDAEIEKEIQKKFTKIISRLKGEGELTLFLNGLLSKTERVMLAKRLLVLYFLENGTSAQEIADSLNISTATTSRLNLKRQLEHKNLEAVFKKMDRQALREELKDFAKQIGLKIATHIARGGRIPLPKNAPY
ncbi:MAG: hypothetical protein JW991_02895 [Candidatus Pacebacteria bacterium]|nr:hypothetical protein [Candidatus Paceibacterota bacterium]